MHGSIAASTPRDIAPRSGSVRASDLAGCAEVQTAGQRVWLMPERAAWWASGRTLLVADLHLGKSQTLRASGAAIPGGVLEESLTRLSRALARTGAERVLVLGDLVHAGAGVTHELVERVGAWRRGFPGSVVVVPGNHDRSAGADALGRLVRAWDLTLAEPGFTEERLTFAHEPGEVEGRFVWAGHVHPAVTIRGAGDRVKLPCFVVGERCGILPAFSRFTAGGGGDWGTARVLAIAEGRVFEVQARAETPSAAMFETRSDS